MAISNYDANPDLINYWIDNIEEAPKDFVDYYKDLLEYVNKHTDTYD